MAQIDYAGLRAYGLGHWASRFTVKVKSKIPPIREGFRSWEFCVKSESPGT